jgi:hypothetical protein
MQYINDWGLDPQDQVTLHNAGAAEISSRTSRYDKDYNVAITPEKKMEFGFIGRQLSLPGVEKHPYVDPHYTRSTLERLK